MALQQMEAGIRWEIIGMKKDRYKSIALFFSIYFIEGLITVFFSLNVVYLMERNIPLSSIGLLSFVALIPLLFKPFVGALVSLVSGNDAGTGAGYGALIGPGIDSAHYYPRAYYHGVKSIFK